MKHYEAADVPQKAVVVKKLWRGDAVGGEHMDIGVPGAFFRGGQQFLSAKTQSCSAKKIQKIIDPM